MTLRAAPAITLALSALLAAAAAFVAIAIALNQPWLGLRLVPVPEHGLVWVAEVHPDGPAAAFAPGQALQEVGGIPLDTGDLVEEPDVAETYAEFAGFLERQDRLADALRQQHVEIRLESEATRTVTVTPTSRPLGSLPAAFWVQLGTGFACAVIGAWVWSLRSSELSARLLALAGASILVSAYPAAIYSSRELALDADLFRWLSAVNHLGSVSFGIAMVALLLVYPRRLAPTWLLWMVPLFVGVWWLGDTAWWPFPGPPTGLHALVLLLMGGILLAAFLQYRRTRDDPTARAALRWFGLSVGVGAGAFVTVIIAPNLLGLAPSISQGYAFLLFLFVFAGVALGVARHRLFELEGWAYRILFYFGAVVLLLVLDALLVSLVAFERMPAFGVSLVAVALLYLPLRDFLARRLAGGRRVDREQLFRRLVDVALAPSQEDRNDGWRRILGEVFAPLHLQDKNPEPMHAPHIIEEGLALVVPAVADLPALTLSYAHGGRRLFSPADVRTAGELCAMLAHAVERRDAYERGVSEERARIARDIHDNIGAQLLTALHSGEGDRKDSLIRETLSDLRDIINNADSGGISLEETVAGLRRETSERLSAAGIAHEWEISGLDGGSPPSAAVVHALRSVLREAVSNIIRHAGASRVKIRLVRRSSTLDFAIEDDGTGLAAAERAGSGLSNMRARTAALGGGLDILDSGGVTIRATFPLEGGAAVAPRPQDFRPLPQRTGARPVGGPAAEEPAQ